MISFADALAIAIDKIKAGEIGLNDLDKETMEIWKEMQKEEMGASDAVKYNGYFIEWNDEKFCWCIRNSNGALVREPYWTTCYEARKAIDSGEAL